MTLEILAKQNYNIDMESTHQYFDYAATTPLHPDVLAAMMPYFQTCYGNPSSSHFYGQQAFLAVDDARVSLANHFALNSTDDLFFTGSSTEACNVVIRSFVMKYWLKCQNPGHLLLSSVEHSAVKETALQLAAEGFCDIEFLKVDRYGFISLDELKEKIRGNTVLVSIIAANNEIGTIQSLSSIYSICQEMGVPFHTDATQYAAHVLFRAKDIADFVTIAAHKCYGPKGIGAVLMSQPHEPILPFVTGAKQENGRRAGTQNVPYIVGMAKAYEILQHEAPTRFAKEADFRDQIVRALEHKISDCVLTGDRSQRLTNLASFAFENVDSLLLQSFLDQNGFCVSIGSACKSAQKRGQQQLIEIGLGDAWINGGLRISVGMNTTQNAVDALIPLILAGVEKIRAVYQ